VNERLHGGVWPRKARSRSFAGRKTRRECRLQLTGAKFLSVTSNLLGVWWFEGCLRRAIATETSGLLGKSTGTSGPKTNGVTERRRVWHEVGRRGKEAQSRTVLAPAEISEQQARRTVFENRL
jgi:hypothetical protein